MNAYIFPGQGSQFSGMGKDLYEESPLAREWFERGNHIIGFRITDIMFNGTEEELKQTKIAQPAIFLHSIISALVLKEQFKPEMVAGHSLGELSALMVINALSFEEALKLVIKRSEAMQKACEKQASAMAAILGLDDDIVEAICADIEEIVAPANYNCPGQLVISGTLEGIRIACEKLKEAGAKRVLPLNVSGAFHSPLMESARLEFEAVVQETDFRTPICPIYQNVNALPDIDPEIIKKNVTSQLTLPVKWTQSIRTMLMDGASSFTELGPGNVLQGLVKKINKNVLIQSAKLSG